MNHVIVLPRKTRGNKKIMVISVSRRNIKNVMTFLKLWVKATMGNQLAWRRLIMDLRNMLPVCLICILC